MYLLNFELWKFCFVKERCKEYVFNFLGTWILYYFESLKAAPGPMISPALDLHLRYPFQRVFLFNAIFPREKSALAIAGRAIKMDHPGVSSGFAGCRLPHWLQLLLHRWSPPSPAAVEGSLPFDLDLNLPPPPEIAWTSPPAKLN